MISRSSSSAILTTVRRDPFARATLIRKTLPRSDRRTCAWCGSPAKFQYYWESDSINVSQAPRNIVPQFCGIDCSNCYNA